MTTFGHSLTGLAALIIIIPPWIGWWRRLAWIVIFIALASIPDWPLPGWGHQNLDVSHSLWVNLGLCFVVACILKKTFPDRYGKTSILLAFGFTWLSHILLDTLYGNLPGVSIFWPFNDTLVSLPIPWLKTPPHVPPPFDAEVVWILFAELMTFAPLILIGYLFRDVWVGKDVA